MLGEHGLYHKGPYCYDGLMRIPLMVRVPGGPGRDVNRHVSILDVNRTLVEWMGLEPDVPNVDSRSLLPLIGQGEGAWDDADEAFYRYEWYNGNWYGIRAIRTTRYKFCWNPVGRDELYDLKDDPHEMRNRIDAAECREAVRRLQRRLLDHLRQTQDPLCDRLNAEVERARPRT
jgi:arylsulfatase A-like enzyme